jgi:predicted RNase H-like HicB family nuclease
MYPYTAYMENVMSSRNKISPAVELRISLRPGADGYVVAECFDIPGCVSQGKDEQEAMDNIQDVVRTCFAMILREWMQKARVHRHLPPVAQQERREAVQVTFVKTGAVA